MHKKTKGVQVGGLIELSKGSMKKRECVFFQTMGVNGDTAACEGGVVRKYWSL